ncbi:unnamed protein product [Parnassius mnemosyne]|uniref:Integrase catalytic domain-containing protein n=1 Tax=Parnassius mnemosyne TaxID=213953 RepID=A0AAV1LS15_9NEOP
MPPKTSCEWITPSKPWSRINVDFAGPFQNKTFLIVVDAYSRWPEVFIVNNMTSGTVIRHLRNMFATHGLCETLVSDNGTAFVSTEMKIFLEANKIKHVTTAPYHPTTNGLAERMVQTIKDKLRKMDDIPWDIKLPNILLGLRVTPCTATKKSPAELLMNRRLRTLLDTLHPDNHQQRKRTQQIISNAQKINRESETGQNVMYRNYGNGPRWLPGTIVNRNGPSSYEITTEDGSLINRHIDQLINRRQSEMSAITRREDEEMSKKEDIADNSEIMDNNLAEEITGYNLEKDKTDNEVREEIIEIPSQEKWAEMLGIPTNMEVTYSGGKIRNKMNVHSKSPYERPSNNFIA